MFFKKKVFTLIFLIISFIGTATLASGGGGNDDSNDNDSFGGESSAIEERVVDQTYESGKAIYNGRNKAVAKLSYCLRIDDQVIPVKRKNIKPLKKTSYSELAAKLYRCDEPEQSIKSELERTEFLHVLYYLDKRYKLKLERS